MNWLAAGRATAATEQILDAAGRLFEEHGPASVGMDAVARAAGCSRATLYRYFDNRHALLVAYAHREANAVIAQIQPEITAIQDPAEGATRAILACLREVRSRPHLAAWYTGDVGTLSEILRESPLIEAMTVGLVRVPGAPEDRDLARWVLRGIVSLLSVPGADANEERRLVERFLAPHLKA